MPFPFNVPKHIATPLGTDDRKPEISPHGGQAPDQPVVIVPEGSESGSAIYKKDRVGLPNLAFALRKPSNRDCHRQFFDRFRKIDLRAAALIAESALEEWPKAFPRKQGAARGGLPIEFPVSV